MVIVWVRVRFGVGAGLVKEKWSGSVEVRVTIRVTVWLV